MSRPRARVSPGTLNRRLHLQERVTGQDPNFGFAFDCWRTRATVWGRIESQRGQERTAASLTFQVLTVIITIRYRDDIEASWRIIEGDTVDVECGGLPDGQQEPVPGSTIWNIEAIEQQDERGRYLNITARSDAIQP